MSSIGERLRLLRESKGLSQTEVAKLLGVNRTTYVHYETGYYVQSIKKHTNK